MTGPRKVTFIPAVSFTGYPDGKKMQFTIDVESEPIPADYLDLLREKGLVDEKRSSKAKEGKSE